MLLKAIRLNWWGDQHRRYRMLYSEFIAGLTPERQKAVAKQFLEAVARQNELNVWNVDPIDLDIIKSRVAVAQREPHFPTYWLNWAIEMALEKHAIGEDEVRKILGFVDRSAVPA